MKTLKISKYPDRKPLLDDIKPMFDYIKSLKQED